MRNPSPPPVSIELEHRSTVIESIPSLQPAPPRENVRAVSHKSPPRASLGDGRGESEIADSSLNQAKPDVEDGRPELLSAGPVSAAALAHTLVDLTSEIYTALPLSTERREIRVLDIDTDKDTAAAITGTLRVIDLDHEPSFTALSYTWGDYATPKNTIILRNNGCRFAVTKNCLSALRHLCKILGPFTIWIDAICINQNDNVEIMHQIALMDKVYSSAQTVYFWLGEGTKQTDKAMSYLARGALPFRTGIFNHVQQVQLMDAKIPTGHSMSLRLGLHLFFRVLSYRIRPHYNGLDDIFGRPWIRRMWTLQEAVLPQHAVIVCGNRTIPWLSMSYSLAFIEFLHKNTPTLVFTSNVREWYHLKSIWDNHLYFSDESSHEELCKELRRHQKALRKGWAIFTAIRSSSVALLGLLAIAEIVTTFSISLSAQSTDVLKALVIIIVVNLVLIIEVLKINTLFLRPNFRHDCRMYPFSASESLVIELQHRQTTKAADKYFAVLSFLNQPRPLPLSIPLETVYRILFQRVVAHSQNLDVLLLTPSRMPGAPSWVVDWRDASTTWFRLLYYVERRTIRMCKINLLYREWTFKTSRYPGAAPAKLLRWKFRRGAQMHVPGHFISTLTWSSGLMKELSEGNPTEQEISGSVEGFMTAIEGFEEYHQGIEHLARHAAGDDGYTLNRWKYMMDNGLKTGYRRWVVGLLRVQARRAAGWTRMVRDTSTWWVHRAMTNFLARENMGLVRCQSETLTDWGWAHGGAREGDVLALISGVSLPMVLRRRKDAKSYEVVGPAFFLGVMKGDVWGRPELGKLKNIVLV